MVGYVVLTLIELSGVHYCAKDKIVLFKFVAYTDRSSFSNACHSIEEALSQPVTQQWAIIGPTCFTQGPDMGCQQRPHGYMQLGNWSAQYTLRNDGLLSGHGPLSGR